MNDEQKQRYEEQLDDADVKAILLGIHSELTHMRRLLGEPEKQDERWECHDCHETFGVKGDLISHAIETHKAPPNMDAQEYGRLV